MKKNNFYRIVSAMLIMSICMCDLSQYVSANGSKNTTVENVASQTTDEVSSQDTGNESEDISKEDSVIEKTLDTTTFEGENGQKELVVHGYNVRYEDEKGKLIDYDPSLVKVDTETTESGNNLEGYIYENKDGDSKQYIPEKLTEETPILMENGDYQISFRPVFKDEKMPIQMDDSVQQMVEESEAVTVLEDKESKQQTVEVINTDAISESDLEKVELATETVENIYEEEVDIENTATYVTEDKNVELQYVSLENGVKENIILKSCPESNLFSYEFTLPGLTPVLSEETKEILLYNKKQEVVGAINAPNMNDATLDAYSEDITYQIMKKEETEDTYVLHMIVSKEYLEAEDRVYPVTIDPTVSWTGSSQIDDVYVISGSTYGDMNFYDKDIVVMSAGRSSKGLYRNYMKFNGLASTLNNKYVESAKLTLYETANSNSGKTVQAYQVKAAWDKTKITYNNRAGYYSEAALSSFKTSGTAGAEKTLDLTSYARTIANGSKEDYGVILRVSDEAASNSYTQFYSSRHSTTARRPKLSVVYYDGPTNATSVFLTNGYIKPGQKATINWDGISSKGLSHVEYRARKFNESTGESEDTDYIKYSSSTKIGTTGKGSATIDTSNWPAGCYRIYVRGVDKGGIRGGGVATKLHIDGTNPTISSATIEPATSSSGYSKNATPKITWKSSETHLGSVQYSVDGGKTFKATGKGLNDSYVIPSNVLTQSGAYDIVIRVKDKAGNYADRKAGTYYYDNKAPVLVESKVTPVTSAQQYSSQRRPTVSWNYSEHKMKSVQISVNGGAYKQIGTTNSGQAEVDGIEMKKGIYQLKIKAIDTAGYVTETALPAYYYNPNAEYIKYLTLYSLLVIFNKKACN